jgi:osmotically-inducible protein OsmY
MNAEHLHMANPVNETDADRLISEQLVTILESAPELETETDVSFFVRNCVVTVSGTASRASTHAELISRVRDATGVDRVIDRLTDRQ